jgi:class 3 adenylate cyclase
MLPSGRVTFVMSDIEGSTRLFHRLGSGYAPLLAEHRELLRHAFAQHSGVEVETEGDALLVAFGDATAPSSPRWTVSGP